MCVKVALFALVFTFTTSVLFLHTPIEGHSGIRHTSHIPLIGSVEHLWAAYSPYFPAGEYQPLPDRCGVTQVNVIQRHGARFPTSSAAGAIKTAVRKLQAATHFNDTRFGFLTNYTYDLGVDSLVPFGAEESFEAGHLQFRRYAHLVSEEYLPFVRASGSDRVVESARNWIEGFATASNRLYTPRLSVILSEALNNTLDNKMCPNAGNSEGEKRQWESIFATPITARLNAAAPGAKLTNSDTTNLISLCPFETVAKNKTSPFCSLFSLEDFQAYEYLGDLDKYYYTGYGQELGRVQGVGYVNELLARLTGQPVKDHTQTNSTLDASPATFPLNRTIYADFSHDNQMIAIYAALGLFGQARALDPLEPDPDRTWVASRMVPFSARMVVERVRCAAEEHGEYVRIFVNDALQPLPFCGAGEDGLCRLGAFVESQAFSRSDGAGDFDKCFDNVHERYVMKEAAHRDAYV